MSLVEVIEWAGVQDNHKEKLQDYINENLSGSEFFIMSEDSKDKYIYDLIREEVWSFKTEFILEHINVELNEREYKSTVKALQEMQESLCESANEIFYLLIKDRFIEFVENAVGADGYGHFISRYDGEEHEVKIDGIYYYIYRQN